MLLLSLTALLGFGSAKAIQGTASHDCDQSGKCIEIATQWVPYDVTRDNYGRFVADRYLAFDVAVENKTGSTVYVNAFLFIQKDQEDHPDLNLDAKLVRGSIEKGQMVGRRNESIEILKAVGTVGSGLSGFFKATGSAASAGRIIAAYNGPLLTGVEAIFSDTTVKYLNNWDQDTVFKNGFVVPDGQTQRGRVFLPIEALFPKYKKRDPGKGHRLLDGSHKSPRDFRADEIDALIKDVQVLGFQATAVQSLTKKDSRLRR